MRKEERQRAILAMLNPTDPVQSKTLIEHFRVTDMTIRRDLNELAAQGKLIRTFGGAVLVSAEPEIGPQADGAPAAVASAPPEGAAPAPRPVPDRILEPAYTARARERGSQKAAIARVCAGMLEGKKYVYLDSGSTTNCIAKLVTPHTPCIFLTNGINIAEELLLRDCASVIFIGGEIHLNTWSARGTFAETQIRALHADIAFLGCNAISPEGGVMIGNMTETGVKRATMDVSHEIYLVVDSSKFDTYSLTAYASIRDFTGIITDSQLSPEVLNKLEAIGARVIIAD